MHTASRGGKCNAADQRKGIASALTRTRRRIRTSALSSPPLLHNFRARCFNDGFYHVKPWDIVGEKCTCDQGCAHIDYKGRSMICSEGSASTALHVATMGRCCCSGEEKMGNAFAESTSRMREVMWGV